jgi:uncharacterized membrane protein
MFRWCVVVFLFIAGALQAQEYPALFDVTGVASNDALNIRTEPSAKAPVIGVLAYDAKYIEVVEQKGNWGRVNQRGSTGWVSMRFMKRLPETDFGNAYAFGCSGAEPFWTISAVTGARATFSAPDVAGRTYILGNMRRASGRFSPHALLGTTPDGAEALTLVVDNAICSDGMSDMLYGLRATLVLNGQEQRVFSGCCSLEVE